LFLTIGVFFITKNTFAASSTLYNNNSFGTPTFNCVVDRDYVNCAQTFTLGFDSFITDIVAAVANDTDATHLKVQIQASSSGNPSGTNLDEVDIAPYAVNCRTNGCDVGGFNTSTCYEAGDYFVNYQLATPTGIDSWYVGSITTSTPLLKHRVTTSTSWADEASRRTGLIINGEFTTCAGGGSSSTASSTDIITYQLEIVSFLQQAVGFGFLIGLILGALFLVFKFIW